MNKRTFMDAAQLFENIRKKKSFLCVGLDPDPSRIPPHLATAVDPVYEFNRAIVDATAAYAVAYKPNLAFYECRGVKGWESLLKTVRYIRHHYPDIFLIADAKRGDIGNTSKKYAAAFFDSTVSGFDFDAVTVAPYMGEDSVSPFLEYSGKWVILLALTSNRGADDFQLMIEGDSGLRLFEKVITRSQSWGGADRMMYVVGATRAEMVDHIRNLVPAHFFLVPGVGAQGGNLQEVARCGMNRQCGLLVNASRAVIHADTTEQFADKAREAAALLQSEMTELLKWKRLI